MFVKGIRIRIDIFIKNQILLFMFQSLFLVIIFPIVICCIYSPSNFKMDSSIYRLAQITVPLLAGFYEIEILKNWYAGKNNEIMWFVDDNPWIYATIFNIIYCFEALMGIFVIYKSGMDLGYEWIDVVGLCIIAQLTGAATIMLCKEELIGKLLSVGSVVIFSFSSKSTFFWQNEIRLYINIKKTIVFCIVYLFVWKMLTNKKLYMFKLK